MKFICIVLFHKFPHFCFALYTETTILLLLGHFVQTKANYNFCRINIKLNSVTNLLIYNSKIYIRYSFIRYGSNLINIDSNFF